LSTVSHRKNFNAARQFLPRASPHSARRTTGEGARLRRSRRTTATFLRRPYGSCRACRKLGSRQRHLSFQSSTIPLSFGRVDGPESARPLCHRLIPACSKADRVGGRGAVNG
jgi:hypothetical protein